MPFVRCYALGCYRAKGTESTDSDRRVQRLVWALKDDRVWTDRAGEKRDPAKVVARYIARATCGAFVARDSAVLVPMPRHGRTPERPYLREWPAARLADELVKAGLGIAMFTALRRVRDVPSSRTSGASKPTIADHVASLELRGVLPPAPVILVDDVLTRGTHMAAAQTLLRAEGHHAIGFAAAFTRLLGRDDPEREGVFLVEWSDGDAHPTRRADVEPFWER